MDANLHFPCSVSTRIVYDTNTRPVYRPRMTLGKRIQAARKAAGLTQAQLTDACGWEPGSRLANYEQGTREPSLADLKLIAEQVKAGGHTYAQIVLGDVASPSQPVGLDLEMLKSAIVAVKESLKKAELELDAFVAAPVIAFAYQERIKLPRDLPKAKLREFDQQIWQHLQGEIAHDSGQGQVAQGSKNRAEIPPPRAKKAGRR